MSQYGKIRDRIQAFFANSYLCFKSIVNCLMTLLCVIPQKYGILGSFITTRKTLENDAVF